MDKLIMLRPDLDALPPLPSLPSGYTLRAYRDEDIEGLTALLQTAFPESGWTQEKTLAELVNDPNVKRIYVIEHEGKIVATTSALLEPDAHPGTGIIHWVAADPAHKGKRLGYLVSLAVLHEFVRLGCKDSLLRTNDHRLPAIKTYVNLGFEPEMNDETMPDRWAKITAALT
jgi:mycothiol synthase